MKYAYARLSTGDQPHALLRRLKTLQEGDPLGFCSRSVWKLDRLGRSLRDLIGHRFLWPALRTAERRQRRGLFNPAPPEASLSRDREGAVTKRAM
jgi:hypothetical protein